MKRLLSYLVTILTLSCCSQETKKIKEQPVSQDLPFPKEPIGWVSDFEKIFTAEQVIYLDSILSDEEKQTGNEVALVTLSLDSTQIKNTDYFNALSLSLFNTWGFGKKDKSNGIGILIAKNLKRIRIEVGYGLQEKLTDEEAQMIINSIIIPLFKAEDYYTGIRIALQAIFKEIK